MFLEKRIPFALRAHELLVPLGLRPRGTSDDVPRCRVVLSSIVVGADVMVVGCGLVNLLSVDSVLF